MKRKILLVCLVVALLSLASVGTYANYVKTTTATNVITSGGIDIALHETGEELMTILPGDVVSKTITVKNTGSNPAYLRVELTTGVNDPALTAGNCIHFNIDETHWTYSDGYYYYNAALEAGQVTEPLFTEVTFVGKEVTNAYLGKLFSLDVDVYAVQSQHNGATPLDAQGWPEA